MTEEQMTKKLYGFYKLYWMMSHGYNLADLMQKLKDYSCDADDNADIASTFKDWENNAGFDGMIWICYDEFCDVELFMPDYIKKILAVANDKELTKAYQKWLKNEL